MAYTQADIDRLKKAIASGAQRSRVGDRDVQFRDLKDMRSVLADMEREVKGGTPKRMVRVTAVKGFDR